MWKRQSRLTKWNAVGRWLFEDREHASGGGRAWCGKPGWPLAPAGGLEPRVREILGFVQHDDQTAVASLADHAGHRGEVSDLRGQCIGDHGFT